MSALQAAITTRILGLVHELCNKRIHVTKRDLFYTDVKLFEVSWGVVDWLGVGSRAGN
jgi:DNA topoisomerase VI subunit A